tara:strand:- start:413 stop:583 length:171 start_codon:yes stop_codon:yes gene_type:complete
MEGFPSKERLLQQISRDFTIAFSLRSAQPPLQWFSEDVFVVKRNQRWVSPTEKRKG